MISTSWFFFLIFLVPLGGFLLWMMKQDKRKGWLGIIVISVMVIVAIIVSLRASRNAANNFELRKQQQIENTTQPTTPAEND